MSKPPKDNEKRQKQVRLTERGNRASKKESNNSDNDNDQKIYASMAHISGKDWSSSRAFGNSSKLTNWVLDSGATCHMTSYVSDFIPGSLEDTDKYIEAVDGHHVTKEKKYKLKLKCASKTEILSSWHYST